MTGSPHEQDTAAIQTVFERLVEAWDRADAKAFASRFAADGSFVNVFGMVFYGRDAFEARHKEMFEKVAPGSRVAMSMRKLRFIRPDVAVADMDCELIGAGAMPPTMRGVDGIVRTVLQLVLVRDNGEWWITAFHNVAVAQLPPRS